MSDAFAQVRARSGTMGHLGQSVTRTHPVAWVGRDLRVRNQHLTSVRGPTADGYSVGETGTRDSRTLLFAESMA